ncbi:MAG: hypothetical protein ACKVH0_21330, partial [Alphaproteobacteria bacterium]
MLREFIDLEATLAADPNAAPQRNNNANNANGANGAAPYVNGSNGAAPAENGAANGHVNGSANGSAALHAVNGTGGHVNGETVNGAAADGEESETKAEGEGTEAATDDNDDDEFDNNLSLAAMELAVLPGVIAALAAIAELQPGVVALQLSRLGEMEGNDQLSDEARKNYV